MPIARPFTVAIRDSRASSRRAQGLKRVHASPASPGVLDVEDLSVVCGGETVLSRVSFSLEAATITAVIGPNGSGKTTLLRALLGLVNIG